MAVGCQPDEELQLAPQALNNCTINSESLIDVNWVHTAGILATLTFSSEGVYYENFENDGNWSLINDCDSIFVTRPSNSFFYRIETLDPDTLRLYNPVFGIVTFFSE